MEKLTDKLKKCKDFITEHQNTVKTAGIIFIMIAAVVFFGPKGEKDEIQIQLPEDQAQVSAEATEEAPAEDIYVDISGQVKNPGVYKVSDGTRLFEVIELAGGLGTEADPDGFNQAEIVSDGQKVIIPAKGEVNSLPGSQGMTSSGLININTADSTALQEIPGIGPATADKIIAYRNENGRFTSKEDIKKVSGIGDKTYEKMKDKITT